jgi:hypothetical protein
LGEKFDNLRTGIISSPRLYHIVKQKPYVGLRQPEKKSREDIEKSLS